MLFSPCQAPTHSDVWVMSPLSRSRDWDGQYLEVSKQTRVPDPVFLSCVRRKGLVLLQLIPGVGPGMLRTSQRIKMLFQLLPEIRTHMDGHSKVTHITGRDDGILALFFS